MNRTPQKQRKEQKKILKNDSLNLPKFDEKHY